MKNKRCYCGRSLHAKKKITPQFTHPPRYCSTCGAPYSYTEGIETEWNYQSTPESPYMRYTNPAPSRKGNYNLSVYQYLSESLAKSSINGINNCVSTSNIFGKIIWLIVFCFCASGFGYQTTKFYSLYRTKPSVVQIEVENEGVVDFPAVTVCNTNRIRKSAFCKHFPSKCGKGVKIRMGAFEINKIFYDLMLDGKYDVKMDLGHNRSMVISCDFVGTPNLIGEQCMEIWEYFFDPDYGNCYTFTSKTKDNQHIKARDVDFWQEQNDLSIMFDLQPEENLEEHRSPGIVIVIHDFHTEPDIHTHGMQLIPGLLYTVAVAKSTVKLLPLPFKTNCTDYMALPWKNVYFNEKWLTSRTCTVGCSQYFQLNNCQYVTKNISLFSNKLPYNKEDITQEKINCAYAEEKATMDYCRSICGLPCRESMYAPTKGASRLTGKETEVVEVMANRYSPMNFTYERVLVQVKIFFSTLEHKIYRHIPKYDTMELFSYLGGYSGVWLGFSLLTVYEIIEILISTLVYFFHKLLNQNQHKKIAATFLNPRKNPKFYKKKKHIR